MSASLFQVDLSGVLKILSDHLYSRQEVFIRELLQNAVDAIKARQKQASFDPQITLEYYQTGDKVGLVFSDNGIGLSQEEAKEFLSRIGLSSKSLDQVAGLRNDYIGQFGIGILSCFMVSDEIRVLSKSERSPKAIRWIGHIGGSYQLEEVDEEMETGTKVILSLRKKDTLTAGQVQQNLRTYGEYLGVPIQLEVNGQQSLSLQNAFPWEGEIQGDVALRAGNEVFGENFHNFFYLRDNQNQIMGVAYILPRPPVAGKAPDSRIYIKRMFITENSDKILPNWAFFLKVFLNTDQISPTASREDIYQNVQSNALKSSIASQIKDYLLDLSQKSPDTLDQILHVHSTSLKRMALSEPGFLKLIYPWFSFPTTRGKLRLSEILDQCETLLHLPDIDEFRQIVPIAEANNQLVVNSGYIYDADLFAQIAKIDPDHRYLAINAGYFGDILKDLSLEEYDRYHQRIETLGQHLLPFQVKIEVKRFAPDTIPAIFHADNQQLISRDIQNIRKESNDLWNSVSDLFWDSEAQSYSRLFLNLNNQLVTDLLDQNDSSLEKTVIETIYTNALMLGHYPLSQKELTLMNENLHILIQRSLNSTP